MREYTYKTVDIVVNQTYKSLDTVWIWCGLNRSVEPIKHGLNVDMVKSERDLICSLQHGPCEMSSDSLTEIIKSRGQKKRKKMDSVSNQQFSIKYYVEIFQTVSNSKRHLLSKVLNKGEKDILTEIIKSHTAIS